MEALTLLSKITPSNREEILSSLSEQEKIAILEGLHEFVKGGTPNLETSQLLSKFLSLFSEEDVFGFLQRIKADGFLQQFCDSLADHPNLFHWVRMSKILLTKSEKNFLRQILTILNEKRYMDVPMGIQILRILNKEMTSPLRRDTTVELGNKILDFLWPIPKPTLRVILEIRPTKPFDIDDWIIRTRQIIAQCKAQQQHSE
jgi:hypothetical protein